MSNLDELLTSTKKYKEEEEDVMAWTLDDFEIGECLGNGKFGYVYRAVEKSNNKECAIKVICKKIVSQFNFYDQLKNEIEIHTRLT
jgi:serine/threonine protein kinase